MHKSIKNLIAEEDATAIGDQVTVVDDGEVYDGAVAGLNPDGSVKISFKSTRKPKMDKSYKKDQYNIFKKHVPPTNGQTAAPGTQN